MTSTGNPLTEKISELCEELKRTALWKTPMPDWVNHYGKAAEREVAFCEWLQFIYLPNLLAQLDHNNSVSDNPSLVPQAIRFFGNDVQKGRLLQLLIELDSLS